MQMEVKLWSELTANPKAEVLCLMKETAAEEKEAEQRKVSVIQVSDETTILCVHFNISKKRWMRFFFWATCACPDLWPRRFYTLPRPSLSSLPLSFARVTRSLEGLCASISMATRGVLRPAQCTWLKLSSSDSSHSSHSSHSSLPVTLRCTVAGVEQSVTDWGGRGVGEENLTSSLKGRDFKIFVLMNLLC